MSETKLISQNDPAALNAVAEALRAGKPVIIPTDTVYGLAALASDAQAIEELFVLKDRPENKAVAVLVADTSQAETVARFGEAEQRLASRYWPGPLTIVAPVAPGSKVTPAGDGTIGVRVPNNEFVQTLATEVGPLATTSANRSGDPTPLSAHAAMASLSGSAAVVVDAGPLSGTPSTVVRCAHGKLELLRRGDLDPADMANVASLIYTPA